MFDLQYPKKLFEISQHRKNEIRNIKQRICSTCKVSRNRCEFHKQEWKKGKAASCILCHRNGKHIKCYFCKESKEASDFFHTKKESASCKKCIVQAGYNIVCSTCKISKNRAYFSRAQRRRGEAACCKECVEYMICSK